MKKLLALFLCLSIVGCSGGGAPQVSEQNTADESKQVTKATDTKPELKAEVTTPSTTAPVKTSLQRQALMRHKK